MDEIASSNLFMSSREALREKALAAWKFTPSATSKEKEKCGGGGACNIVEASQRDMEFVVRALQRELNSGPRADHLLVNADRIFTERTWNKNIDIKNPGVSNSDESLPKKLAGKKRCRESGKSPVTVVTADPVSFRAMVHQATGGTNSGRAATQVVKPQPKRPFLPSPDSSCLNSNPYLPVPYSFPGAVNSFYYSINDLPASQGGPLYNPGLAAITVGMPSPSSMPSEFGNYGEYLNRYGNSATPERFRDWNRSEFS